MFPFLSGQCLGVGLRGHTRTWCLRSGLADFWLLHLLSLGPHCGLGSGLFGPSVVPSLWSRLLTPAVGSRVSLPTDTFRACTGSQRDGVLSSQLMLALQLGLGSHCGNSSGRSTALVPKVQRYLPLSSSPPPLMTRQSLWPSLVTSSFLP